MNINVLDSPRKSLTRDMILFDSKKPKEINRLITVCQIEQSVPFALVPTIFKTPVWRYVLWIVNYEKHLTFMADKDDYPDIPYSVNHLIVDYENYVKTVSLHECYAIPKSCYTDNNILYAHFTNDNPPLLYPNMKPGMLVGFTNSEPLTVGGTVYLPDLVEVPFLEDSVDPITYTKIKFYGGNITVGNSSGIFDKLISIFGNDLNILVGEKGENFENFKRVMQYYIDDYSITLNRANLIVKDKRERLSGKAPDKYFRENNFPYIDRKYLDKIMQDAYGVCYGVNGICLESQKLYEDGTYTMKKRFYRFRFADKITRLDSVEVKMSDEWKKIYPTMKTYDVNNNPIETVVIPPENIDYKNGIILLSYLQARIEGKYDKGMNDVRADGIFNSKQNPGDIVADIMERYAGVQFSDKYFNKPEWESELRKLPDIGLCLDAEKSVYEWIEKIQNSSIVGFQLFGIFDRFTVRLDNPNRPATFKIGSRDIVNKEEIEICFNAGLYATSVKVEYAYNYNQKEYRNVIDESKRIEIRDVHRFDKEYVTESMLTGTGLPDITGEPDNGKNLAELKAKILLEDFRKIRPVIRNIKLNGVKWFDIMLFDIGEIDFSIESDEIGSWPHNLLALVDYMERKKKHIADYSEQREKILIWPKNKKTINDREFAGILRCQIIKKAVDTVTGEVTLDVRQRDPIDILPF